MVGELNVDVILNNISAFPELDKEIIAEKMEIVMGSSSAIFACNIAALGADTGFIGRVGEDDSGEYVIQCLKNKNIDISSIIYNKEMKTGSTFILNYSQNRAMITYPGVMEKLTIHDINFDYVRSAKHLHLSSYFLQKGIRKDCSELFARAKKAGLTTSLDTNWDPSEKWETDIFHVLPYVDVFLPNKNEALYITREREVEFALEILSKYTNTVAIKLGAKGVIAKHNNSIIKVKPLKVNPVDEIGAGDSFDAGFIYKYLQSVSIEDCLHFGNLCGALSITKAGGTAAFENPRQIKRDLERLSGAEVFGNKYSNIRSG